MRETLDDLRALVANEVGLPPNSLPRSLALSTQPNRSLTAPSPLHSYSDDDCRELEEYRKHTQSTSPATSPADVREERVRRRKEFRDDVHLKTFKCLQTTLNLQRIHTSPYNFNCLAFSTFGAAGLLDPSAPDAASRVAGDAARAQIHDELVPHLPTSATDQYAWHAGLTRAQAQAIFEVRGRSVTTCDQ